MSDKKIIFSMQGVSKIFPPQKQVLKNIWLSFYYGAKIGVLGLNGSGKSSLLKIIAGLDTDYQGKIVFDKEYKIGYLPQEPVLDEHKTVKESVKEGVSHIVEVIEAYEAISLKLGEPMDDDEMMKLIEEQGELLEQMDHLEAWDLDHTLEVAMEALRCPPDDTPVKVLSGGERRRVALCR
ncbi:MAG: ATP-binding cassette domain-containing protein, partial [Bacteroidota bacterium]